MRVSPVVVALVAVLGGALVMSGCRRAQPLCAFCHMPIPAQTAARVEVDGRVHQVCDPRCALTHQQQTGEISRLLRVTDFESGRPLDPERAYYLSGSDTAPDVGQETLRPPMDPVYREWHRCLPSVLAFADRETAVRYQRLHGGRIETLGELGYRQHAGAAVQGG